LRKLTMIIAGLATVWVSVAGVAAADTRQVRVFGPFASKIACVAKQNDADKGGWRITAPCHDTAVGKWWFKAVR
jgi:hypothetical protein